VPEYSDDDAHRRLWASVIIQALIDATNDSKNSNRQHEKRQAVAWISTEVGTTAQNFEEVCLAANIEPTLVRNFFKTYEGPPLNLHILVRMRNQFLKGTTDANSNAEVDYSARPA
jgi:hypothetical protein